MTSGVNSCETKEAGMREWPIDEEEWVRIGGYVIVGLLVATALMYVEYGVRHGLESLWTLPG
jgi:hypothetical protein